MTTNGICRSAFKMMIKVMKLSGTKTDEELPGASEGFPACSEQQPFIFNLHCGLRARSRAEVLCKNTVGRSTQTLNLSLLELLDLFMPSLDITRKYCRGYKLFPESILMSRSP